MNTVPPIGAALAALLLLSGCASQSHIKRSGWVTGLRPEKSAHYKDLHAHPWPTVNKTIKDCHSPNFSIYAKKIEGREFLFAYLEYTGKNFDADMKKMAADSETRRWWKETDPCQSALPDAKAKGKIWSDADLIYHLD